LIKFIAQIDVFSFNPEPALPKNTG